MKTFNSINDQALFIKVTRRENKIVGVYVPARHTETNIFLSMIRMDYTPSEMVHIVRGLQTYAYDFGMLSVTPPRLDAANDIAMGYWWQAMADAVNDYLEDTLPSEEEQYWAAIEQMVAHANIVLTRMRRLAVI